MDRIGDRPITSVNGASPFTPCKFDVDGDRHCTCKRTLTLPVVDLHTILNTCLPRPRFLLFLAVFGEIWSNNRLAPLWKVLNAPLTANVFGPREPMCASLFAHTYINLSATSIHKCVNCTKYQRRFAHKTSLIVFQESISEPVYWSETLELFFQNLNQRRLYSFQHPPPPPQTSNPSIELDILPWL